MAPRCADRRLCDVQEHHHCLEAARGLVSSLEWWLACESAQPQAHESPRCAARTWMHAGDSSRRPGDPRALLAGGRAGRVNEEETRPRHSSLTTHTIIVFKVH